MRRSVGASVSTRRSGRSVPARSGAMGPSARGADFTTPPHAVGLLLPSRQDGEVAVRVRPAVLRMGGFQSAGAAGGRSRRSPRAPRVRIGVGRRWPEAQRREQRGSRRRGALRGRGRRSVRAQCAGAHTPAPRHPRHWQNRRASRSDGKKPSSWPAGQNKTSTEWKTREGPPTRRARRKPHAVETKRKWWRRGESNPRPEDLGRWCLRAQPTFGSRRGGWV